MTCEESIISAKTTLFQALYYGVAQFLPRSYMPGGRVGRALRAACARRLFAGFGEGAMIESRVEFGSGRQLTLGADSAIGARSVLGTVTIGEHVMIGQELLALSRNHNFDDLTKPPKYQGFAEDEPITIGDDCWIGARVILLPGVTIGRHCIIGAGSVVTRDVEDHSVVGGSPARVIRSLREGGADGSPNGGE